MKRQQGRESGASSGQQPQSAANRVYTSTQIIGLLQISRSSFFHLKRRGALPFLHALHVGRSVRYRADLVDRYLAGRPIPHVVVSR